MPEYSTISLPKELYDILQKLIEDKPELGYGSVADFCKEAIRLHVEGIKRELREDFLRKLDVPLLLKKLETLSGLNAGVYGKAFERMRDMAFLLSKDFIIKDCNMEMVSHLGYSIKEELIGKDVEEIFEYNNLKNLIKRSGIGDIEARALRKDGKKIDVLLSIGKMDGGDISYIGVAKDITVRKYVEDKERRERKLYEYLINEMCDIVLVLQDKKIKFVNKSITTSGWERGEIIGKNIMEFIAEEDKERLMENYKKAIQGMDLGKPRKYKLLCKDGKKIEAEILSRKIEFEGRPALLVTVRFLSSC